MRTIPEIAIKKPYLCETDLFFDKANFVTFSDELVNCFIKLYKEYKLNSSLPSKDETSIVGAILKPYFYNQARNTLYLPSYLIDNFLDLTSKKNIALIVSKLLDNCGINLTRSQLDKFKSTYKLKDLIKIIEVDNKNISFGLVPPKSEESYYNSRVYFEIDMPGINKIQIDGINISHSIPISDACFNYILSNTILAAGKTHGNFRLYRATLPPVEIKFRYNYYRRRNSNDDGTLLARFDYRPITGDDYQLLSKEKDFPRIKKKGEMYSDPSNFVNVLDDLIPGHVYVVPSIKHSFVDQNRAPEGNNYLAQFLYLGTVRTIDKPDNQWNYSGTVYGNMDYNHDCICSVPFYRSKKTSDRSGSFKLNSFHGGKKDYVCNVNLRVFVNIGQLARFRSQTTYAIDESFLNTCEKFMDNFTEQLMPELLDKLVDLSRRTPNTGYAFIDYFDTKAHRSSLNIPNVSLLSVNSPVIVTLEDGSFSKRSPVSLKIPSFIDVGELFDGSSFDFTEFFNRITVKTLELWNKNNFDFYITEDCCVDFVNPSNPQPQHLYKYISVYRDLPLLPWVTPELYNLNPEVKKAILGSLKGGIKDAADVFMFSLIKVWEHEQSQYRYGTLPSYGNDIVTFIKNRLQSRPDFKEIIDVLKYMDCVFSNVNSGGNLSPICAISKEHILSGCDFFVEKEYITEMLEPLLKFRDQCESFCTMILSLSDYWKQARELWEKKGYATAPGTAQFNDFVLALRADLNDLEKVTNIYYNWFANFIYDEYINKGLYKNSELMWIDKFKIKKEDLLNLELKH